MKMLPILLYHGIYDEDSSPEEKADRFFVSLKDFTDQIEWLSKNGWRTITFRELDEGNELLEKRCIITFDDGYLSAYEKGMPVLLNRGMKAVVFIAPEDKQDIDHIGKEQIRLLHEKGMEIGSHGLTHTILKGLGQDELQRELTRSREAISELTDETPPVSLSIPHGRFDHRVLREAQNAGYQYICTSIPGINRGQKLFKYLERIVIHNSEGVERVSSLTSGTRCLLMKEKGFYHIKSTVRTILGENIYRRIRVWIRGNGSC